MAKEYICQTVSESQADRLRKQALKGMNTWWCGADFALDRMREHKLFEQWDTDDLQYRPFNYDELNEWLEWAYEEYYGEDL